MVCHPFEAIAQQVQHGLQGMSRAASHGCADVATDWRCNAFAVVRTVGVKRQRRAQRVVMRSDN